MNSCMFICMITCYTYVLKTQRYKLQVQFSSGSLAPDGALACDRNYKRLKNK